MNFFASEDTKKIKLKSGIELEVKTDISKRAFNNLVANIPQAAEDKGFTVMQATDFSSALFNVFVVGWSLDREATVENYLELKRQHADEIDEAISNHFTSMNVTEKEARKS
jgi:hypothetical protein